MTTIEVWDAIVVQDHENKRHKFLLNIGTHRFDDINDLTDELIREYRNKPWINNTKYEKSN